MPQPKDPYEVLGVAEDATDKAIKSAYRKLAQQYHPDRNAGDTSAEERFKEIQAAYDVLGDKTKRAAHDRARRDPFGGRFEGTPFGGASGGSSRFYRAPDGTYVRVDDTGSGSGSEDGRFSFDGGGGLGDIFDQFFGGAGGSAGPGSPSGRDVDMTVRLSFEDALAGGRREIQPFTGETVRISIPKGVRDGFRIKLSGRGEPSPTGRGEAGDLYITFQVAAHDRFTREGDDLVVTETVSALDAMLGTTREVTTADGKTVRLKVKPGTQPGTRLRVRGQGVETAARRGDLYVVVHVHVPTLSQDTREALRRWAEAHGLAGAD